MAEEVKKIDSRRVFVETLTEFATKDDRIVLLYPDVGFSYLEMFAKKFPDRCINTGVTEQSTVLIAAAMALSGFKPYVYSMINFVLFRPGEMVRNGIVKHNANVKLIGVKGSEKYAFLGFSHNLLHDKEDTNFCENVGLAWHAPSLEEVRDVIVNTYNSTSPAYIRL